MRPADQPPEAQQARVTTLALQPLLLLPLQLLLFLSLQLQLLLLLLLLHPVAPAPWLSPLSLL
jgi:hypothetical protein